MFKKLFIFYLPIFYFYPLVVDAASPGCQELRSIVDAQGRLLTEYQQSVGDVQREIDFLRGQLQEARYKLDQTVERQKVILKWLDESTDGSLARGKATKEKKDGLGSWRPSGNEKADYGDIVDNILKGYRLDFYIGALELFAKRYPESQYLSNVNYWLGQLNYQKNRKKEASYYFANVVKQYPESIKAAESMFKLGLILQEEGKKDKAKIIFEQIVAKYPRDSAIIEQVKKQQQQLN